MVQEVADAVEAGAFFVVRLNDGPRRVAGVGVEEHGVFGFGVVVPAVERFNIYRRKFPVFQRIVAAGDEAAQLFFARHGKPEFKQVHTAVHQHAFQFGRLAHELQVFVRLAKTHHAFYTGAVVPRSVEKHHFAGGGQMVDVTLEIPLSALAVAGFLQGHHAGAARVEVLHIAFDGAALAGGITAFKYGGNAAATIFHPALYFEQLDL